MNKSPSAKPALAGNVRVTAAVTNSPVFKELVPAPPTCEKGGDFTVTVDPEPDVFDPERPFIDIVFEAGTAFPESVEKVVGTVTPAVTVKMLPAPEVVMPPLPTTLKILAAGVADPELVVNVVGTAAPAFKSIVPEPTVIKTELLDEASEPTRIFGATVDPIANCPSALNFGPLVPSNDMLSAYIVPLLKPGIRHL